MRESIIQRQRDTFQRDFGMGLVRFIGSRDIWLALDDNDMDSRRMPVVNSVHLGRVLSVELVRYHRQLFYWLMLRQCQGPTGYQTLNAPRRAIDQL